MPTETTLTSTIYDIRHVTTYNYRFATPFARCILRLAPVDRPGQRVIETKMSFDPVPNESEDGLDTLGNRLTRIAFNLPHRQLTIRVISRVEVCAVTLSEASINTSPAWDSLSESVLSERRLDGLAPVNFLFASRYVPLLPPVMEYVAMAMTPSRAVIAGALDLAKRIYRDFAYDPTATTISTPLTEVFTRKRGVCQDFAHLMISGLRSLGIPAAYVSGYLRTVPPPGQARLEGADAMHAWVAVWGGADLGWVGLDPTNGIMAGNSHVIVAIGRDYSDVSPLDGVVMTSGDQNMRVAVDVIEVPRPTAKSPTEENIAADTASAPPTDAVKLTSAR